MLILASQSPTRQRLLRDAGLRFRAVGAVINERRVEAELSRTGAEPPALALGLAEAKALDVSRENHDDLVIGADQVLNSAGEVLHKPMDMDEAERQLARLSGQTHHLHAGVALACNGELLWRHVESAELAMRRSTQAERRRILALEGEAALGSVGAYRLEGPSIQLFESVKGDYFTVLGLPLLPLLGAIREHSPCLFEDPPY